MKIQRILLSLAILISAFFTSNAQERVINGMVTTFDSIPLVGADVKVQSTKLVVKTDTLGRFYVTVNDQDKLKVTAKGFYPQSIKIEKNIKMALVNMKLKPSPKSKEYAIGYGYVKDAEKLNALAQLNDNEVDFSQYSNMYDLIRGRFAGVTVQNNGDIIIRGVNSINLSSAALIVIDGVSCDKSMLDALSPVNVKSINVIKDGSSAIYGARGANGVVIIETKK